MALTVVADENIPRIEEALQAVAEVRLRPGRSLKRDDLREADALLVRSITRVNEELLDGTPVKFVGTATIGVDHIDEEYLRDSGIGFASASGCNANSVREYVVAALLELAVRHGFSLEGKTLGIVGHGNIGSKLSKTAPILGMTVLVNDPPLERAGVDYPFVDLEELLRESDFVTCHVPLNREGPDRTVGLIGPAEFRRMKAGAFLLNSSRGSVVVGQALVEALREGTIRGAVLDVFESEPSISREVFDALEIGTPHIAGYSFEGKMNGTTMMAEAVGRHFHREICWEPKLPRPEGYLIDRLPESLADSERERILLEAVRRSYSILEDDASLRRGRALPDPDWGRHFDSLRRSYPVRREFANYQVGSGGALSGVRDQLTGLGFSGAGS